MVDLILEKPTVCRYCGNPVVFTSNAEIYGKEYGNGKCFLCRKCKADAAEFFRLDVPKPR